MLWSTGLPGASALKACSESEPAESPVSDGVAPDMPGSAPPALACPEEDIVSQVPLGWLGSVDCDDPVLDGGHPKSLCDDEPTAPPLVDPPRLKLPAPLFVPFDPPKPDEPPKLLELPNPD